MRRQIIIAVAFITAAILFVAQYLKDTFVKDAGKPEFSIADESIEISTKDPDSFLLKEVSAYDQKDGDLSGAVFVESVSAFTDKGSRIVRYAVTDSDQNVAHCERDLTYTDYKKPRFAFAGDLSCEVNTNHGIAGISATDVLDGDVTQKVHVLSDSLDLTETGEYDAAVKVSNSAGDSSMIPVTVEVYDPEEKKVLPRLELASYLVYIRDGEKFYPEQYLKRAVVNGCEYSFVDGVGTYESQGEGNTSEPLTISRNIVRIDRKVQTGTDECWQFEYTLHDYRYGTGTGKARLYLVVTGED